jgi:hypothetical protein
MKTPTIRRKRLPAAFDVMDAVLAAEGNSPSSGKRKHRGASTPDNNNEVMERSRKGLQKILMAIEERLRSVPAGRLVRILSGIYDCNEPRLEIDDLRILNAGLQPHASTASNFASCGPCEPIRPACMQAVPAPINWTSRVPTTFLAAPYRTLSIGNS